MSVFEKKSIGQLARFLLVGVSNTLVDLVVTRLLQGAFGLLTTAVVLTYYIPKVVGFGCGVLNSYVLNSAWTFRAERHRDAREIGSFLLVNLLTLGLSLLLMYLLRDVFGLAAWWSGLVGTEGFGRLVTGEFFCTLLSTGICLLVNFVGNKLFVFGKR
ncbi:MAG: GtrA family protein [Clostridia bacterium]|jgi:putative flippase GtrA|nr:GtrA family protein [Clostridia bacterium]MBR3271282.1 GtrA family protein [Clostridia bacterium]